MYEPKRRNRSTLVCTFCKRRKIRCDKNQPCSSCVAHGNSVCEYQTPSASTNDKSAATQQIDVRSTDISVTNDSAAFTLPSLAGSDANDQMEVELLALRSKVEMLEKLLEQRLQKEKKPALWKYTSEEFATKRLGVNPCAHESEFVSLQDNYVSFETMGSTSLRNYGPLSWVAMIKSDPAVSPVLRYRREEVLRLPINKDARPLSGVFATNTIGDAIVNEELDFKPISQRSRESRFGKDTLDNYNLQARNLGFPVCTKDILQEHDLIEKVRVLIPAERAMWRYIDIFFSKVYQFLPFVDQEAFEIRVRRMVSTNPNDLSVHLKIVKHMDLIYLGQLLLVLRFGYLNLFTPIPQPRRKQVMDLEREYLLDNPVAMETLEVAILCLQQVNYFRTCNLPVLQLVLFIKLYYLYGPEYGESPEDTNTQASTALLLKMGMSIGLHREPENLKLANDDKRMNNLRRKLWYGLLSLDYDGCIGNGFPHTIQKNNFDTEIPHYVAGTENVKDREIEKVLTMRFFQINNCCELTRPILEQIASIRIPIALKTFCADLSQWEQKYFRKNNLILRDIDGPLTVENIYDCVMFFNMALLSISTLYHLHLHYDKLGNIDLSYFYLKKTFLGVVRHVMFASKKFVDCSDVWFQNSSHIVFVPAFENVIHRSIVFLQAFLVRTRFSVLKCETLTSHKFKLANDAKYVTTYRLLTSTFDKVNESLRVIFECINKLSSRYCYSWRCTKAQEILYSARNGEDYYLNFCRGKEVYLKLNFDMLVDFELIVTDALNDVNNNYKNPNKPEQPTLTNISTTSSGSNIDTMDFVNMFWLQMHLMKGHPDESVVEPDISFFDFEIFDAMN